MSNTNHGGKGDKRRPLVVDEEQFNNNWDAIFKKVVNDIVEKEALKPNEGGVPLLKDTK
jgi:hypothetical protein